MAESPVIYALTAKRAELSGLILDLERQAARHKAELVHLDATLRLFDPDAVPALIRPKGKAHPSTVFATEELSRFIMGTIREEALVSSRDLAVRMMEWKGMDVSDRKTLHAMQIKVRAALAGLRRRGVLVSVGSGWDTVWKAADDSNPTPI